MLLLLKPQGVAQGTSFNFLCNKQTVVAVKKKKSPLMEPPGLLGHVSQNHVVESISNPVLVSVPLQHSVDSSLVILISAPCSLRIRFF